MFCSQERFQKVSANKISKVFFLVLFYLVKAVLDKLNIVATDI